MGLQDLTASAAKALTPCSPAAPSDLFHLPHISTKMQSYLSLRIRALQTYLRSHCFSKLYRPFGFSSTEIFLKPLWKQSAPPMGDRGEQTPRDGARTLLNAWWSCPQGRTRPLFCALLIPFGLHECRAIAPCLSSLQMLWFMGWEFLILTCKTEQKVTELGSVGTTCSAALTCATFSNLLPFWVSFVLCRMRITLVGKRRIFKMSQTYKK